MPSRSSRSDGSSQNQHARGPVYASDLRQTNQASANLGEATEPTRGSENRAGRGESGGSSESATQDSMVDLPQLSPLRTGLREDQRPGEVQRLAQEAFAATGNWVVFYRLMMAPGGIVDQLYPGAEQRRQFEATEAFAELLEMVTSIRSSDDTKSRSVEPERVITVRMPRSLHEATIREAEELELSINKYCLTKLLQPANQRFVPLESGRRRGRRPGPQIVVGKVRVPVGAGGNTSTTGVTTTKVPANPPARSKGNKSNGKVATKGKVSASGPKAKTSSKSRTKS